MYVVEKCNICDLNIYKQSYAHYSNFENATLTEVDDFIGHLRAPTLWGFHCGLVIIFLDDLHITVAVFSSP